MAYVEGDLPISTGGNGEGMFGAGGWWAGIIGLVAVAAIFGRNGGLFGGNNGQAVTQADLCTSLNFNNLDSAVRSIGDSVNVGFANLNSTICNQQYDTARMIDGVNTSMLQGFNTLQSQLAQCCCNLERGQERIACGEAQNTAAIISAGRENTQRILDYLCNEKIASLQNAAQSQYIINSVTEKLMPVARPAYITCSPYASAFGYPYANGGCNCNGNNPIIQ